MRVSDLGEVARRVALHLGLDPARTTVVMEGDFYLKGPPLGSAHLMRSEILQSAPSVADALEETRQALLRGLWSELRTVRRTTAMLKGDPEHALFLRVLQDQEHYLVSRTTFLECANERSW